MKNKIEIISKIKFLHHKHDLPEINFSRWDAKLLAKYLQNLKKSIAQYHPAA